MDRYELSEDERRELEALLEPLVAAGLLEAYVKDGKMTYRITELGRAAPAHAWDAVTAPNVRLH